MSDLSHMLRPRSIAVIGASETRMAQGNVVLANLSNAGYEGQVTVVHPTAQVIAGLPTVSSISDLPDGIDVAMVCVPAPSVVNTLAGLEKIGCPAAITVAAGFSDEEDQRLREVVATLDIDVSGPNCMGMIDVANGVPLYTARYRENLPAGKVSVIAQSGSAAIALANFQGIGYSKIITSGNEYGVTAADYVEWLASDPDTDVVGLIAESVRDPERFERAVRKLHKNGKSIVVLKVGRSKVGAQATSAHTRAIVGANEAYSAYFRRLGVPTVRDYDELGSALQCLSTSPYRASGDRIGVISISGGQGALACDVADEEGMQLAELSAEASRRLRELMPGTNGLNPLDLGASVGSKAHRFDALKAFAEDDQVDAIVVMQDAQDTLPIHSNHDYLPHVRNIVELGAALQKPIVLVSNTGANTHHMIDDVVKGSHVPLLRGMRPGFAGLRTLINHRNAAPSVDAIELDGCPKRDVLDLLRNEVRAESGTLSRHMTLRLLEAYGIRYAQSVVVNDEKAAVEEAQRLGYPLVVKLVSAGVSHKTDVGGVKTDVRDEAMLCEAMSEIRGAAATQGISVDGFELQEYVTGDVEAVVGFSDDAVLGPLVVLGTGGLLVELADDHSSALAPISDHDARRMLTETRMGRLLCGYRGIMPVTDLSELEELTRRMGRLASDMSGLLSVGDLNPVMVSAGSGRAVVVDALLISRTS
ncbi:acetate--CoA ligase family protein [Nocardioides insulae]|uniref:acetate--CoA ligase family protein n=1 Tax=Nocardioides insulae TaxID=394734 RepID=UPI00042471E6|nr:acetate--CoA ligase family protein [Nocardioides insulae]